MLDTDQLRSFLAIVDSGSFRRAAERVNKTQSAVSMHIRRLEEQLGCELFAREGRGVRLAGGGEKLVDHARRMLQVEAAALAAVGNKGLSGSVRLGMPDDYAEPFLPGILARFTRSHPQAEVSVVCEHTLGIAARVASRDIDLGVVTDCAEIDGVEILRQSPLRWVVAAGARFGGRNSLPLALGGPTCDWRRLATAALAQAGIASRLLLASNNYAAVAPVVQAGLAVTVLPQDLLPAGLEFADASLGLPALPPCSIGLIQAPGAKSRETLALADDIRAAMRGEGARRRAA